MVTESARVELLCDGRMLVNELPNDLHASVGFVDAIGIPERLSGFDRKLLHLIIALPMCEGVHEFRVQDAAALVAYAAILKEARGFHLKHAAIFGGKAFVIL